MNFWQWLYNLLAFVTLPFYISALFNLLNRGTNVRKTCLGCLIYLLDTLVGLVYTVYFVHFWFSREDSQPGSYGANNGAGSLKLEVSSYRKRAAQNRSQSASPSRELFLTVSGTIITSALRLYFCFVFLSFTKQLLKQAQINQRNHGTDSVSEQVVHPTSFVGRVKRFVYDLEMRAKLYFTDLFA